MEKRVFLSEVVWGIELLTLIEKVRKFIFGVFQKKTAKNQENAQKLKNLQKLKEETPQTTIQTGLEESFLCAVCCHLGMEQGRC